MPITQSITPLIEAIRDSERYDALELLESDPRKSREYSDRHDHANSRILSIVQSLSAAKAETLLEATVQLLAAYSWTAHGFNSDEADEPERHHQRLMHSAVSLLQKQIPDFPDALHDYLMDEKLSPWRE